MAKPKEPVPYEKLTFCKIEDEAGYLWLTAEYPRGDSLDDGNYIVQYRVKKTDELSKAYEEQKKILYDLIVEEAAKN